MASTRIIWESLVTSSWVFGQNAQAFGCPRVAFSAKFAFPVTIPWQAPLAVSCLSPQQKWTDCGSDALDIDFQNIRPICMGIGQSAGPCASPTIVWISRSVASSQTITCKTPIVTVFLLLLGIFCHLASIIIIWESLFTSSWDFGQNAQAFGCPRVAFSAKVAFPLTIPWLAPLAVSSLSPQQTWIDCGSDALDIDFQDIHTICMGMGQSVGPCASPTIGWISSSAASPQTITCKTPMVTVFLLLLGIP